MGRRSYEKILGASFIDELSSFRCGGVSGGVSGVVLVLSMVDDDCWMV